MLDSAAERLQSGNLRIGALRGADRGESGRADQCFFAFIFCSLLFVLAVSFIAQYAEARDVPGRRRESSFVPPRPVFNCCGKIDRLAFDVAHACPVHGSVRATTERIAATMHNRRDIRGGALRRTCAGAPGPLAGANRCAATAATARRIGEAMGWKKSADRNHGLVDGPLLPATVSIRIADTPREILVLRPERFRRTAHHQRRLFEALRQTISDDALIAGVGSWGRPITREQSLRRRDRGNRRAPWNNKARRGPLAPAKTCCVFLWKSSTGRPHCSARGGFDVGIDVLGTLHGRAADDAYGRAVSRWRARLSRALERLSARLSEFAARQLPAAPALAQRANCSARTALPEARPQTVP
ncbi:hypothetical protein ACFFYR_11905 [Paraburkholderia dipogonis]|uniref:hypothetical protein n=1 Tax=Paraburkholderia dipogonis TaxID=1211383 RepID=UPI0035E8EC61